MLIKSVIVLVFLKASLSNSYPFEYHFELKENDIDPNSVEMDCGSNKTFYNVWNSGGTGSLYVPIPKDVETWKVRLTFSSPVTNLQVWDGLNIECTRNECLLENQGYNAGIQLKFDFLMDKMDFVPDLVALTVNECVYIKEREE
jgi:hypothetical protein